MSFLSARSWAADIHYRLQKHTSHTDGRHFLELDCSGLSQESRSYVLDFGERRLFYLSLALPIIHLRLLGNTARPGPNPINPPILFWTEPSPWNVNTWLNSILCCNQSSIYYDNGCDSKPFTKSGFWKAYFERQHRTTTFVLWFKEKTWFAILSQIFSSLWTKPLVHHVGRGRGQRKGFNTSSVNNTKYVHMS